MHLEHISQDPKQQRRDIRKFARTMKAGIRFLSKKSKNLLPSAHAGVYLFMNKSEIPNICLVHGHFVLIVEQEAFKIVDYKSGYRLTEDCVRDLAKATTITDIIISGQNFYEREDTVFKYIDDNYPHMRSCKLFKEPLEDFYLSGEYIFRAMRACRTIFPGKYEREAMGVVFGDTQQPQVHVFRITSQPCLMGVIIQKKDQQFKTLKALENESQL